MGDWGGIMTGQFGIATAWLELQSCRAVVIPLD